MNFGGVSIPDSVPDSAPDPQAMIAEKLEEQKAEFMKQIEEYKTKLEAKSKEVGDMKTAIAEQVEAKKKEMEEQKNALENKMKEAIEEQKNALEQKMEEAKNALEKKMEEAKTAFEKTLEEQKKKFEEKFNEMKNSILGKMGGEIKTAIVTTSAKVGEFVGKEVKNILEKVMGFVHVCVKKGILQSKYPKPVMDLFCTEIIDNMWPELKNSVVATVFGGEVKEDPAAAGGGGCGGCLLTCFGCCVKSAEVPSAEDAAGLGAGCAEQFNAISQGLLEVVNNIPKQIPILEPIIATIMPKEEEETKEDNVVAC